jgi:hypothetical protein
MIESAPVANYVAAAFDGGHELLPTTASEEYDGTMFVDAFGGVGPAFFKSLRATNEKEVEDGLRAVRDALKKAEASRRSTRNVSSPSVSFRFFPFISFQRSNSDRYANYYTSTPRSFIRRRSRFDRKKTPTARSRSGLGTASTTSSPPRSRRACRSCCGTTAASRSAPSSKRWG